MTRGVRSIRWARHRPTSPAACGSAAWVGSAFTLSATSWRGRIIGGGGSEIGSVSARRLRERGAKTRGENGMEIVEMLGGRVTIIGPRGALDRSGAPPFGDRIFAVID